MQLTFSQNTFSRIQSKIAEHVSLKVLMQTSYMDIDSNETAYTVDRLLGNLI